MKLGIHSLFVFWGFRVAGFVLYNKEDRIDFRPRRSQSHIRVFVSALKAEAEAGGLVLSYLLHWSVAKLGLLPVLQDQKATVDLAHRELALSDF